MWKMHEIREIIKLFEESALEEMKIELESSESQFYFKKQAGATIRSNHEKIQVVNPVTEPAPAALTVKETPTPVKKEKGKIAKEKHPKNVNMDDPSLKKIVSPMVGTFYEASSPDGDPFVRVGDRVDSSTIVCILEAMKLFNEIEAEVSGEIVEILVEDGHLVEHGQSLFLVKPE